MNPIDGKQIAHYRFPDGFDQLDQTSLGRIAISKKFRNEVLEHYGEIDIFTRAVTSPREIQIDHRIPFRISGDPKQPFDVANFMPVSAAMNRAKSWECEACPNWEERVIEICESCYWAMPDGRYEHVATKPIRRIDLVWQGTSETIEFDHLVKLSRLHELTIHALVKKLLSESLSGDS